MKFRTSSSDAFHLRSEGATSPPGLIALARLNLIIGTANLIGSLIKRSRPQPTSAKESVIVGIASCTAAKDTNAEQAKQEHPCHAHHAASLCEKRKARTATTTQTDSGGDSLNRVFLNRESFRPSDSRVV